MPTDRQVKGDRIEMEGGKLICMKGKHYMGSKNNLTWVESGYKKGVVTTNKAEERQTHAWQ